MQVGVRGDVWGYGMACISLLLEIIKMYEPKNRKPLNIWFFMYYAFKIHGLGVEGI